MQIRTKSLKKRFFPKNHSQFTLNTSKKQVDKPIFMNCHGFYYLSNEKYQILENNLQKHSGEIKTLVSNNFILNRFQFLALKKRTNGLLRPFFGTMTVSITF